MLRLSKIAALAAAFSVFSTCIPAGAEEASCASGKGVPHLDGEAVAWLKDRGIEIRALDKLGAEVLGLDLRSTSKGKDDELLQVLQKQMAARGYLVFRGQGVLTGDEQVGPQWHNDGSFVRATFSHVGYHIIRVPENGGATSFSHQGAAFDALSPGEQEAWERRASINSNSGVVHPLVHKHPISGKKSVWLHLGMTGAVLEKRPGVGAVTNHLTDFRLLDGAEMSALFHRYNDLMNDPAFSTDHHYQEGDIVIIDNLAVAHRATVEAHSCPTKQGLRILHRTTVKGMINFDAASDFGLPSEIYIHGKSPYGPGVFQGGGTGFRWDPNARLQN